MRLLTLAIRNFIGARDVSIELPTPVAVVAGR